MGLGKLFNPDSKLSILLNRVADFIILGFLWLACCLPVFTVGAATTALYYTSLKLLAGEESYFTRDFFHSFKMNFKQATLLWIAAVGVGVFLAFDIALCRNMGNAVATVAVIGFACIYVLTMLYIFPYLSKFYCTFAQAIKAALFMSFRHIGQSILLLVINGFLVATAWYNPFLIILLPAVSTYLNSLIFKGIFKKYIPAKPEETAAPNEE